MTTIFHLAPTTEIERAARAGVYRPARLETDGFIHCSHAHQVQAVADRLFRDVPALTLLEIETDHLEARMIEEGTQERFPHIYGPLPMSAVISVRELTRGSDGRFKMPCTVTGECACKAGAGLP
jgi:uncharacterized protein (DUF952 family)